MACWELGPFVKRRTPVLDPDSRSPFRCPVSDRDVAWESQNVYNPAAIVKDGRVHLFYRADDANWWKRGEADAPTCRLGMAWSEDGVRFTRHPTPVLYPDRDFLGEYEWPGGLWDPRVFEDGSGTYYLYYNTDDNRRFRLIAATSIDLVHWRKIGNVFAKADPRGNNISGSVVWRLEGERRVAARIGGKYWMYYDHHARVAASDDLVSWTPTGAQIWEPGYRTGHFDSASGEPGTALLTDRGIVFLYVGQNHGWGPEHGADPAIPPGTWSIGQALIDGKDPTRLLERTEKPLLQPTLDWEIEGYTPNATVMHDGLVFFKGRWLLYYGGGDRHIGVAMWNSDAGGTEPCTQ